MKKTLVALAALAASGAFAQSSVTIFGAVDASFNYQNADLASATPGGPNVNQSRQSMGNSQLGSSKLGFKGSEDLGGGLRANFWLEGGLQNDNGAGKATNTNNQPSGAGSSSGSTGLVFQRRSYVGLSGTWGEIQLGRQYVSTFLDVQASVDPFGTNGPADSTQMMLLVGAYLGKSSNSINASNMFGYITPTFAGGFQATGQVWLGENTSGYSNSDDGSGYSVSAHYGAGPIWVSLGQMGVKYNKLSQANVPNGLGDYQLQSVAASYNFGMAKILYTYANESVTSGGTVGAGSDWKNTSNLFGVVVPWGAANFKLDYIMATNNFNATQKNTNGNLFGIGVDYALSKRTIAYATWGGVSNSDGGNLYSNAGGMTGAVGPDGKTSNLAIGVYHSF